MDVDPTKLSRNISFGSNRFDQDYQFCIFDIYIYIYRTTYDDLHINIEIQLLVTITLLKIKVLETKVFFKELLMYFINNINIYQFNRFHELPWSRALFLPERKKMHNDKYVQLYEANSFRVIMRKASFAKMYTNTNWHFHDYNKWYNNEMSL